MRLDWTAQARNRRGGSDWMGPVKLTAPAVTPARYPSRMTFSFKADKRRAANRQSPETRKMLAVTRRYGFHSGSESDTETFVELFETFAGLVSGATVPDTQRVGPLVAAEAAGSKYPMAAHAAWAVVSLLPSSTISALSRVMGHAGIVGGATIFTDEFPGLIKTPVLGRRLKLWRAPAAVAVVVLATHADESGITY